jgi:hypothetical protein
MGEVLDLAALAVSKMFSASTHNRSESVTDHCNYITIFLR